MKKSSSLAQLNHFTSLINLINLICDLFRHGFLDATLNTPSAIAIVFSSKKIQSATIKCFILNGVLILGSLALFHLVIISLLPVPSSNTTFPLLESLLSIIFHSFWVYPVYALSFFLNSMWHCDIAIGTLNALSTQSRHVSQIKTQSLSSGQRTIADEIYRALVCIVHLSLALTVYVIPICGPLLAFISISWLNAMYCFEYKWIQQRWSLQRRLKNIEELWPYYLGFGLPSTLLTFFVSPVVSSAMFALLFPISLITATMASHPTGSLQRNQASRSSDEVSLPKKEINGTLSIPRLPVFGPTNYVCRALLMQIPILNRSPTLTSKQPK